MLRSGHATGTIILSGGYELVSSGGTAVATSISGGTLEVASGGTASGVVFSSGGMLQVDSGGIVSGAISAAERSTSAGFLIQQPFGHKELRVLPVPLTKVIPSPLSARTLRGTSA